jgi:hypothetical protein
LTHPQQLSDWAVQAGLVDAVIEISDDELAAAIALREAIYRIGLARLEGGRPKVADVDLLNEHASQPEITPLLHPNGSVSRKAPRRSCSRGWPPICSTFLPDPTLRRSRNVPIRAARASTWSRDIPAVWTLIQTRSLTYLHIQSFSI